MGKWEKTSFKAVTQSQAFIALAALFSVSGIYLYSISFGATFGLMLCAALSAYFLLAAAAAKKCRGRAALVPRIMTAVFLMWALSFLAVMLLVFSGARSDETEKVDYIIVLGAKINGEMPSYTLRERLDTAALFLHGNPETRAVVCGGQGADEVVTEAYAMKKYLVSKGIESDRILEEGESRNTLSSVENAKEIIEAQEAQNGYTAAVVTSETHLFRARLIMKKFGLGPLGIAAKTPYRGLLVTNAVREYFSVVFLAMKSLYI